MNRRSFLKGLGLIVAAAAAPKVIFDMGANSHLYKPTGWEWVYTPGQDPFRVGQYCTAVEMELAPQYSDKVHTELIVREFRYPELNSDAINKAFLAARPLISQEIIEYTVKNPWTI